MLDLDGTVRQNTSLLDGWDHRLPWSLVVPGPRLPQTPIEVTPSLWRGEVLSEGAPATGASVTKASAVLRLGTHEVSWTRIPEDAGVTWVSVAFDVNGRLCGAHQEVNGDCSFIFFDDSLGSWETLALEAGARSPVVALDRTNAAVGLRDVTLSYLLEDGASSKLMIRFQRERYLIAHLVEEGLPNSALLRTAGMSREGRFTWRFRRYIPDA